MQDPRESTAPTVGGDLQAGCGGHQHGLSAPQIRGDAIRLVADLGGYRDRKHGPDPGNRNMWHGQTRLTGPGFKAGRNTH